MINSLTDSRWSTESKCQRGQSTTPNCGPNRFHYTWFCFKRFWSFATVPHVGFLRFRDPSDTNPKRNGGWFQFDRTVSGQVGRFHAKLFISSTCDFVCFCLCVFSWMSKFLSVCVPAGLTSFPQGSSLVLHGNKYVTKTVLSQQPVSRHRRSDLHG